MAKAKGQNNNNKKAAPLKGRAVYFRILHELTVIDRQMPENKKLSYKVRRKLASEFYQKKYKDEKKVRVRDIKADTKKTYDKIKPTGECDINLLPTRFFAESIDWFAIDDFIRTQLPPCIYIRVNAGELGQTKIFNTRNYSYIRSGVRDIFEAIRPEVQDASDAFWSGYKKLKPRKKNDGTPENYFLDFILQIDDEILGDTSQVNFRYRPTKKNKAREKTVHQIIAERVQKKRASDKKKKTFARDMKERMKAIKKAFNDAQKSKQKKKANVAKLKQKYDSAVKRVERAYNEGYITEYTFKRNLKNLLPYKPKK